MNILFATVACVLMTSAMGAAIMDSPKDKCHGLDCPTYTVINKTASWELRQYKEIKWASTNATGIDTDSQRSQMFQLLFQYISGKNSQNTKIPMTAPVVTQVFHGQGPTCESSFTMNFMIPFDQWDSPATPTDPKVFLSTSPLVNVFVKSFGGFAKDQDYMDNLATLSQEVTKNYKVEGSYFYTAGYDGPYQFLNRHNEVWLARA